MKRGKIFILAIILISLITALFIKLGNNKKSPQIPGISNAPDIPSSLTAMLASLNIQSVTGTMKAPAFELTSLDGEKISLGQFHGKAVILSFWSTW